MSADEQISGMSYKTYGLNTPSGNYLANVVTDPKTGMKVIVPSIDGSTTYSSMSGVNKDRLGRRILSTTGVEVTKSKQ